MLLFLRSRIFYIIILLMMVLFLLLFLSFDPVSPISFPASFLTLNTIFISILIEALPFVLIGVIIAGFIQIFITEEHIKKWMPKNKYVAVIVSCLIGSLFPACECGIVPIVRRLVGKGVPLPAAIGFMLTGPLINPIVALSTYMAFGNNLKVATLRIALGFLISLIIAFLVSFIFKKDQLKVPVKLHDTTTDNKKIPFKQKLWHMITHSIDEFFDMVKFLIFGAFLAASVQTFLPARTLLSIGDNFISSLLVMMGLAYILSLCSEADAFIGASFNGLFPLSSILGFLILGPMMDLKNTLMMLSVFRFKFVMGLLALIVSTITIIIMLFQHFI